MMKWWNKKYANVEYNPGILLVQSSKHNVKMLNCSGINSNNTAPVKLGITATWLIKILHLHEKTRENVKSYISKQYIQM